LGGGGGGKKAPFGRAGGVGRGRAGDGGEDGERKNKRKEKLVGTIFFQAVSC